MMTMKTGFQVCAYFPFCDDFAAIDDKLIEIAGQDSHFSGVGNGVRDHGWVVKTFAEAQRLRDSLRVVPEVVSVTIREQ